MPTSKRECQQILLEGGAFTIDDTWLKRAASSLQGPAVPLDVKLVEREKEMIEAALRESHGKVSGPSGAAEKLGIPRQTLDSRILRLNIDKRQFKNLTS